MPPRPTRPPRAPAWLARTRAAARHDLPRLRAPLEWPEPGWVDRARRNNARGPLTETFTFTRADVDNGDVDHLAVTGDWMRRRGRILDRFAYEGRLTIVSGPPVDLSDEYAVLVEIVPRPVLEATP